MDHGMIGKIEKAKRYAEERDRIRFVSFSVTFDGDNSPHSVSYENGTWNCDCSFFRSRAVGSHTISLERILAEILPAQVSTDS